MSALRARARRRDTAARAVGAARHGAAALGVALGAALALLPGRPAPARAAAGQPGALQPPFLDPLDAPAEASPLAPRRPVFAVAALGGRLLAAGERGHLLRSDDGGATWQQGDAPVSTDLAALALVSPDRAFAAGHDGVVLATEDGGLRWARRLDGRAVPALLAAWAEGPGAAALARTPALRAQLELLRSRGADQPLLALWFDDAERGLAVGAFGLALATADGGRTWTPWLDRIPNPDALHLYAVLRTGGDLWIAGERGLLVRCARGAPACDRVALPYAGSLFGLAAPSGGRALVAFGLRGTVLRSAASGEPFRAVETGLEVALVGGAALPGGALALVGQGGQLLVSADGGASFAPAPGGRSRPASAIAPAGGGAMVVAGADGLSVVRVR